MCRYGLALGTVLLVASGCFSYQPTRLESVEPGSSIRVRVSAEEAERLISVGLGERRLVDGTLVRNGVDGLMLDADVTTASSPGGRRALVQRVSIPTGEILEVEQRELDRVRTGLAAGGLTAVVAAVIISQLEGGRGSDQPPGPDPSELRVPLGFRLPIFW
jgi:hypothetical protein